MYYFSFLGLIDCHMRSTHAFMRVYKPHEDKIHICLQCPCYNYYLFIRYYDIGASSFTSAFSNLFFQSYSQRILATACPIWKEEKESVSTVIKSLQKTLLPLEKSVHKKRMRCKNILYIDKTCRMTSQIQFHLTYCRSCREIQASGTNTLWFEAVPCCFYNFTAMLLNSLLFYTVLL